VVSSVLWFGLGARLAFVRQSQSKRHSLEGKIPLPNLPKTLGFHPKPDKLDAV